MNLESFIPNNWVVVIIVSVIMVVVGGGSIELPHLVRRRRGASRDVRNPAAAVAAVADVG